MWPCVKGFIAGMAVALCLVAGGCTREKRSQAPLPADPPRVEVKLNEYRFEHQPVLPNGLVVFHVSNVGRSEHELTLLQLTEDVPPLRDQLRAAERRVVRPIAAVPPRSPGGTGTFAVDLVPGRRYAVVCFVRDPDGQAHALKGMNSEFRASGIAH